MNHHPVSLLSAGEVFTQGGGVNICLGGDEAVEVHGITVEGIRGMWAMISKNHFIRWFKNPDHLRHECSMFRVHWAQHFKMT